MKSNQKHIVASLFAVASLALASVASAQEDPSSPVKGSTAQPTAQAAQQQQGRTLVLGQIAEGNLLDPFGEDEWTFTAQAGDILSLEVASDFDSYLELYDSNGEFITENDDSGSTIFNAKLLVEIPATGVYTAVLSSYDGEEAGPYTLELLEAERAEPGTLAYGEIASTILVGAAEDRWSFQGVQGDVITIAAFGDIDPEIELYDAAGQLLASNDDAFELSVEAVIENIELPANGTYTIVVRDYIGDSGRYMLALGEPWQTAQ